ncbi:MAG TPA: hypothetical protein EYF98_10845 [Planctomycetes bacterium]|nr:hypothetical protein [Planctomycetota bacterium]
MAHGVGYYLDKYAVFAGRQGGRVVALVAALPRHATTPQDAREVVVAQGQYGDPANPDLLRAFTPAVVEH